MSKAKRTIKLNVNDIIQIDNINYTIIKIINEHKELTRKAYILENNDTKEQTTIKHYDLLEKMGGNYTPQETPKQETPKNENKESETKMTQETQTQNNGDGLTNLILNAILPMIQNQVKEQLKDIVLPTKQIVVKTETKTKKIEGLVHKDFEKILNLVSANIPVLVSGGAGAGKSHTIKQVAKALDTEFTCINQVLLKHDLVGYMGTNNKEYVKTPFYDSVKRANEGVKQVIYFAECDGWNPEAFLTLNNFIANGYITFPNGETLTNDNIYFVADANTTGRGANETYTGRQALDGATLDRFALVKFDYDPILEKALAYDIDLYNFITNLRQAIKKNGINFIVSMRATINSTILLNNGTDKKTILETVILKDLTSDDLNTIKYDLDQENIWYKELLKMGVM